MPASAADFAPIRFPTDDLPGAALASRVGDGHGAATQVISHAAEPLRLLVSYLALLQKEVPLATPEVRQAVVDHIHDLATLALANRDTREHGLSAGAAARTRCGARSHRRKFHRAGAYAGNGRAPAGRLAALSAAAVGGIRHVVHGTRERVAAAAGVRAAGQRARSANLRHRVAGRIFRYFELQQAVPVPLRRHPDRRTRAAPTRAHPGRDARLGRRRELDERAGPACRRAFATYRPGLRQPVLQASRCGDASLIERVRNPQRSRAHLTKTFANRRIHWPPCCGIALER